MISLSINQKNFLNWEVNLLLPLDHENAGKVIRKRRKELGLRQSDLVDDVVKLHSIRKAEKGEVVNDDIYMRICEKLDIDLQQLLETYEDECDKEERLRFLLFAIEHDIDLVGPEEGLEQLRNIEIAKDSPLQTFVYFLKGKCYDRKTQWKKAQAQYMKTLSLLNQFPELEDSNLKASTYNELGRCCYYQNNLEQALNYIEKGLESYNKNGERDYIIYHLMISKTIYLEKMSRNEDAFRTLEFLWDHIGEIDSMEIRLSMYEVHSVLLAKQELYEKAAQAATRGIQLARIDQNVDRSFELWTALGESYKNRGDFFKAEICFRTALKLEKKIRKKNMLVSTYTQLGMLYLKSKKISSAQSALLKAVQIGQKTNDALKYCNALVALGDCYMKQGKDLDARSCFQQALSFAEKHGLKIHLPDILVKLAKCCEREDPATYEKYKNRFFQYYVQMMFEKGGEKS